MATQLTQMQHYWKAHRHTADLNEAFMDMVNDKVNPITSTDLRALIERRPDVYGRFKNWIEVLESREVTV